MATIYVEGRARQAKVGENLLQTCLSLGYDLPYFCWHPALGSVGACRQCAVKRFRNEADAQGRIVMACMTPVEEALRISIEDSQAREFRRSVAEWLMLNHPHDCPVCDEGGECHLQDMTLMTGHIYRRYRGEKRTFHNQYLGPFVNHEMNRCIQCYRCVRFYRDYAGGTDLDAYRLRSEVYFGRQSDGVLESEFSGNLVEICPTGVFTDKTLKRHYTRKWDLRSAPSICVHCGLGCNTLPGERMGELRRVHNRYNGAVNGYFLCDRGRYGYEFVNGERRIRRVLRRERRAGAPTAIDKGQALTHLAGLFERGAKAIGIGSPRASLEANFALRRLVGSAQFHHGMGEQESLVIADIVDILRRGPAATPTLPEVERADAVFILGEDLTNTAPRLALALRRSVQWQPRKAAQARGIPHWDEHALQAACGEARGPLFSATLAATKLDAIARRVYYASPDDLARLGYAVAHALDARAPAVAGIPAALAALAQEIAQALSLAERPLVISGASCGAGTVVRAAANVAWALCHAGRPARLCYTVPECNSLGLALMGGKSLESALETVQEGRADTVIVLENDLYRRAEAAQVEALFDAAAQLIVIDHTSHATADKADLLLPACSFAESEGTLVNNEGRAQRYFKVFAPVGDIEESWRWSADLLRASGRAQDAAWRNVDELTAACAAEFPVLAPSVACAPDAQFRLLGQKIPREAHRASGRTAVYADLDVHEPEPRVDEDSALAFSMEGYSGQAPAPLLPRFWAPRWNSIQALNKFQDEVGGPLRGGDPGLRLLEPGPNAKPAYFGAPPAAFEARAGEWLFVPLHYIFGSEELSALAPAVAELCAVPHVALNPQDAAELGLAAGGTVELRVAADVLRLPLQLRAELQRGVAGLPAAVPGLSRIGSPVWGSLSLDRSGAK